MLPDNVTHNLTSHTPSQWEWFYYLIIVRINAPSNDHMFSWPGHTPAVNLSHKNISLEPVFSIPWYSNATRNCYNNFYFLFNAWRRDVGRSFVVSVVRGLPWVHLSWEIQKFYPQNDCFVRCHWKRVEDITNCFYENHSFVDGTLGWINDSMIGFFWRLPASC